MLAHTDTDTDISVPGIGIGMNTRYWSNPTQGATLHLSLCVASFEFVLYSGNTIYLLNL